MVRSAMNIARRRVHRNLRSHRRPRSHRSAMACGGHGPSSYPAPTVPASCRSRQSPIGTPAPPRRHPSVKHRSTERGAIPSVAPTAPIEHLGARNGHGHVQRAPARAPAQPKAQRLVFARWRTPRPGPLTSCRLGWPDYNGNGANRTISRGIAIADPIASAKRALRTIADVQTGVHSTMITMCGPNAT